MRNARLRNMRRSRLRDHKCVRFPGFQKRHETCPVFRPCPVSGTAVVSKQPIRSVSDCAESFSSETSTVCLGIGGEELVLQGLEVFVFRRVAKAP